MIDKFTAFIEKEALFGQNDVVLLAVSGGLDSTVMVYLFAQCSYSFAIAHANFGLRGADSDEDERWVAALAHRWGVPFHTHRFATKDYAHANGLSTQTAARQLRYAWLEAVRSEHHYARVATAHHRNDQLETTLLNLVRGTGVAGLRGMLARRGALVRPLLFAPREALEAYAKQHQLGVARRRVERLGCLPPQPTAAPRCSALATAESQPVEHLRTHPGAAASHRAGTVGRGEAR